MKGNADSSARGRPGALAVLAAAAALALAALALAGCSSSGSSVPPVASLGTSAAPGTSTSADPGTSTGSGTAGTAGCWPGSITAVTPMMANPVSSAIESFIRS